MLINCEVITDVENFDKGEIYLKDNFITGAGSVGFRNVIDKCGEVIGYRVYYNNDEKRLRWSFEFKEPAEKFYESLSAYVIKNGDDIDRIMCLKVKYNMGK